MLQIIAPLGVVLTLCLAVAASLWLIRREAARGAELVPIASADPASSEVSCPTCHVHPGMLCKKRSGGAVVYIIGEVHRSRSSLAAALKELRTHA